MLFPNYRNHYKYLNKVMRLGKMKRLTKKFAKCRFTEVRSDGGTKNAEQSGLAAAREVGSRELRSNIL